MSAVGDVITACLRSTIDQGQQLWSGAVLVTVTQRDPDTGAADATTTPVQVEAVWRGREARVIVNEQGGEQPMELCHWRFPAALFTAWEPRKWDTVEEPDGTVWKIDTVRKVGLTGVSYTAETSRELG